MRILHLSVLAAALAGAGAEARTRDIEASWGKPGVSMTDYRLDAGVCAAKAISVDVADTSAARQLVKASRALDNAYSTAWMYNPPAAGGIWFGSPWQEVRRIQDTFAVDESLDEIRALQLAALRSCLTQRGYRQFALTPEQRQRLKRLALGSEKRRAYLHGLASDPQILAGQGI